MSVEELVDSIGRCRPTWTCQRAFADSIFGAGEVCFHTASMEMPAGRLVGAELSAP